MSTQEEIRDRRYRVFQLLRQKRLPSNAETGRRLGLAGKTIERDVRLLKKELGIEVFETEIDGLRGCSDRTGAWVEDGSGGSSVLAASELRALVLAVESLDRYQDTPLAKPAKDALERLLEGLPLAQYCWALELKGRAKFAGRPGPQLQSEVWDPVLEALYLNQALSVEYSSRSKQETLQRRIDPYILIESDGNWLLYGHCHLRRNKRTFTLAGMENVRVVGPGFSLPKNFDADRYVEDGLGGLNRDRSEPLRYRLRFAKKKSAEAVERAWHRKQEPVTWDEEKRATVTFWTTADFLVERWVLAWGKDVEVLEPEGLRKKLREHAEGMIKQYEQRS